MDKIEWIIQQHRDTNHMYDNILPYEFHLKMASTVCKEYMELLPNLRDYVSLAVWGHDLIEDTRVSYNDVRSKLGQEAADIIYAVTNEKGKTREERANSKYYMGIRETPGAVFVKLCDRIANLRYSKMTGGITQSGSMLAKYKSENSKFEKSLGRYTDNKHLEPMFVEIDKLIGI